MNILVVFIIMEYIYFGCFANSNRDKKIQSLRNDIFNNAWERHLLQTTSYNQTFGSVLPELVRKKRTMYAPIVIRNFLTHSLTSGLGHSYQVFHGYFHPEADVPTFIDSGTIEAFTVVQGLAHYGVSGVAQWRLHDLNMWIRVMWTIPKSFQTRRSFAGCEISTENRTSLDATFDAIFGDEGKHVEASNNNKAIQDLNGIVVFAEMSPSRHHTPHVWLTIASTNPAHMRDFTPKGKVVGNLSKCSAISSATVAHFSDINSNSLTWHRSDIFIMICSSVAFVIGGITVATIIMCCMCLKSCFCPVEQQQDASKPVETEVEVQHEDTLKSPEAALEVHQEETITLAKVEVMDEEQ